METHHHPHVHHRTKWKEYIFQFLMLFIAVFLGSLAEYRLEHYIERQRTKTLAKDLYDELKLDSATAKYRVKQKVQRELDLEYLENYFPDSSLHSPFPVFFASLILGLVHKNLGNFEPKEGILDQLKNSGALRYFHDKQFQISVGELDLYVFRINRKNEDMSLFYENYIHPFLIRHFDFKSLKRPGMVDRDSLIKSFQTDGMPALIEGDRINKTELVNIMSRYRQMLRTSRTFELNVYLEENHRLLQLLREKYGVGE